VLCPTQKLAVFPTLIHSPEDENPTDNLTDELADLIDQPAKAYPEYFTWGLNGSWKLVDAKAEARRCGNTNDAKSLGNCVRKSITSDHKARIEA
jgi:hypothetical protein